MKVIAVILNVCMLGFIVMICVQERPSGLEWVGAVGLAAIPIVNLTYILGYPSEASWLGLYFKRKRLEEKKRIEALETD